MKTQQDLSGLIEKLPADDYETGQEVCEKLLAGGPAVISQLVAMVGDEFGEPQGVKPKYAVHGLVMYVGRSGADDQRALVAETLAKELAADHSDELKAFVVRQLQLCGRPQEVPALARLLSDERLCNPATQALIAIGGEAALKAVRDALPQAGGSCRGAVQQAVDVLSRK